MHNKPTKTLLIDANHQQPEANRQALAHARSNIKALKLARAVATGADALIVRGTALNRQLHQLGQHLQASQFTPISSDYLLQLQSQLARLQQEVVQHKTDIGTWENMRDSCKGGLFNNRKKCQRGHQQSIDTAIASIAAKEAQLAETVASITKEEARLAANSSTALEQARLDAEKQALAAQSNPELVRANAHAQEQKAKNNALLIVAMAVALVALALGTYFILKKIKQ